MTEYIAAIALPRDLAPQAYEKLRDDNEDLAVRGLALIERAPGGGMTVVEQDDLDLGNQVAGGLIGMLVGVLGGPLGMILGAGVGAAVPGIAASVAVDETEDALSGFSRFLTPGASVILAYTDGETGTLDEFVARHDGTIERRKVSDVIAELEAQHKAESAAKKAAQKALWESRKQEWDADLTKRWEHLKAAFGGSRSATDGKS